MPKESNYSILQKKNSVVSKRNLKICRTHSDFPFWTPDMQRKKTSDTKLIWILLVWRQGSMPWIRGLLAVYPRFLQHGGHCPGGGGFHGVPLLLKLVFGV